MCHDDNVRFITSWSQVLNGRRKNKVGEAIKQGTPADTYPVHQRQSGTFEVYLYFLGRRQRKFGVRAILESRLAGQMLQT